MVKENTDNSTASTDEIAISLERDLEFRGETIYFIVVDRFCNGNPENDRGLDDSLFDPNKEDWHKYWGGDLQGIIDKLDYLQSLGITAIWVTPLFEQIENTGWDQAPIHGYWTQDFKRINSRYINNQNEISLFQHDNTTFDVLIKEMHNRGMRLILDIVCNHSSPDANGNKGKIYDDGNLIADFNNDTSNWYHHYGEVHDWNDTWQIQNCELAGLATFNENNDDYRNYIKSAIKQWLDKGVDALRVDTVKHMPIWFWQEFTSDILCHKPTTFIFGEWIYSHPNDMNSVAFANKSGMTILDFGFCMAIRQALGQNAEAGFNIINDLLAKDANYHNATELITFIENHDMLRFMSLGCDESTMQLALILIMTSRGIPCLYYGCEQFLHNDTDGGNDPYNRPMMDRWDLDSNLFKQIAILSDLRRKNSSIKWGGQWVKYLTNDIYCFLRRYHDSRCFVAMNRGGSTTINEVLTDLADGSYTCVLTKKIFNIKDGKIFNLQLGPKEIIILSHIGKAVVGKVIVRIQLNGIKTEPGQIVAIIGDCNELGNWSISQAKPLEYINENTWFGEIAFNESCNMRIAYKYVIINNENGSLIPIHENCTTHKRLLIDRGVTKWRDTWENS